MKYGCKKCILKKESSLEKVCPIHGKYTYNRYAKGACKKCRGWYKKDDHQKFLDKIKNFDWFSDFEILSTYERSNKKILLKNKYGLLEVLPNSLTSGKKPIIHSALNKSEYALNQFKEIHGDFYKYPDFMYISNDSQFNVVCPIHGPFKTIHSTHLKCKCKKCAYEQIDIGFTKEDFIRIANGRICSLYLIKIELSNETFLKIGITSRSLKRRFGGYKYTPISMIMDIDAGVIYEKEKKIHNKLKEFKFKPIAAFNGHTECYKLEYLKEIEHEFRRI